MEITKKEVGLYIKIFIIIFLFGMTLMSFDNFNWITASPEWDSEHTVCNFLGCWEGKVMDYSLGEKINYIVWYRTFTVLTHPRDLFSTLFISLGITLFIIYLLEVLDKKIFHSSLLE